MLQVGSKAAVITVSLLTSILAHDRSDHMLRKSTKAEKLHADRLHNFRCSTAALSTNLLREVCLVLDRQDTYVKDKQ